MARRLKEKEREKARRRQNRQQMKKKKRLAAAATEDPPQPAPQPVPAPPPPPQKLYHMRRNITNMLKKPNENVVYHQCANFDVFEAIHSQPKRQPQSNAKENFEEENEPQLLRVTGNTVIINDKHGVPCVIKAGNNRASKMLEDLESAILKYTTSRTIAADHIRHGAVGTRARYKSNDSSAFPATHETADQNTKDATTLSSPEGNGSKSNGDGSLRRKGCVIHHRAFVGRMQSRTQNIQLGPGPAQSYTTKGAIAALQEFSQHLLPLTQTVESLFKAFLPMEHEKYTAAYNGIHERKLLDPVDQGFGIWTSRSLVMDANTNNHKDLEDVCHGWCALVVLGGFEGGDACFPELGVKIDCPPGSVVFLRSYAVEHYIGSYVGTRYSIVHFTHQTVHDAYVEMTGKKLWEFNRMPKWWQKMRQNLNV